MNREAIDKHASIPLYYQVYKYFEAIICEGVLKPGDVLPGENKIAKDFNISRVTVRRAMSELNTKGLVYTIHGKGTYVSG